MDITPCTTNNITVEFNCQFRVLLKDGSITSILSAFCKLLPHFLADFIQKAVTGYAEYVMGLERKPFYCDNCGNDREFIWKTRHGRETKILTVFAWVTLYQLQIQCKAEK